MFGFSGRELRFAVVISAAHLGQHVLTRLIPPLIPVLAVALEYPLWQLGLLITVFTLGSGLGQAPFGALADRYDRLYILPAGFLLSGAAYVLFAIAPYLGESMPTIHVLRNTFEGGFILMCFAMGVCGLGTAVVHPTSYPLITVNVSDEQKGKVLGMFGSSSKLGDAVAPAVVGLLVLFLSWEGIILVLGFAAVGFGIVLFLALSVDEFATKPANRTGGGDGDTDDSRKASEKTDRRAVLYPITAIYAFSVSKMFASHGIQTFLPAFIVSVYAYSFDGLGFHFAPESVANFYFAALMLFAAATQLVLGGVTDRYDPRFVILGCVAAAVIGLVAFATIDLTPISLLVIVAVLGGGIWGINPARDSLVSEIAPAEHEGRTFGYLWTAVFLTSAPVPVIIGYVIEAAGMRQGFLLLAAGPVLAGLSISLLFSSRVYRQQRPGAGTAQSD